MDNRRIYELYHQDHDPRSFRREDDSFRPDSPVLGSPEDLDPRSAGWQSEADGRSQHDEAVLGDRQWRSQNDRRDFSRERDYNEDRMGLGQQRQRAPFDRANRYSDDLHSRSENRDRLSSRRGEGFMEHVKQTIRNYVGRGPKGYQRSDERILEDVSEALYRHPEIDASEVEIEVKEGNVTLKGCVSDRQTKRLIEDVIENRSGVKDVTNLIRITVPGSLFPAPDKTQAEAAGSKMKSPIP